jgi:hypothetical protein
LRRISLVVLVAVVVMPLVLSGLARAQDSVTPNGYVQYDAYPQYDAAPQYDAYPQYAADPQYGAAAPQYAADVAPTCDQVALDALSDPNNGPTRNQKLLTRYIKCGGTIASLPQDIFNRLEAQFVIITRILNGVSYACPNGDPLQEHCSAV